MTLPPHHNATTVSTHFSHSFQAQQLRAAAQEPYAYRFDRSHYSTDVQEQWEALQPGQEDEAAQVSVAGRVVARRLMGKLAFLAIRDDKGQLQVGSGAGRGGRGEEEGEWDTARGTGFAAVKNLIDIGDIVGASGSVKCTHPTAALVLPVCICTCSCTLKSPSLRLTRRVILQQ
jgi:lysyl-tRNA synthetase class II